MGFDRTVSNGSSDVVCPRNIQLKDSHSCTLSMDKNIGLSTGLLSPKVECLAATAIGEAPSGLVSFGSYCLILSRQLPPHRESPTFLDVLPQ